jgi:hypothetical protein
MHLLKYSEKVGATPRSYKGRVECLQDSLTWAETEKIGQPQGLEWNPLHSLATAVMDLLKMKSQRFYRK